MHGVIAQDVKKAMDDVGNETFGGWTVQENGMQGVFPSSFVYPLINAVNELTKKVEKLEQNK